jgi:hypothetical protein
MITDDVLLQHKWKKFNGKWQKNGVRMKVDNNQRKVYLDFIINENEKLGFFFHHEFDAFDSDISKLEKDITSAIFLILYEEPDCEEKITPKIKRAFHNWTQ